MITGIGTCLGAGAIIFGAFIGRDALSKFREQTKTSKQIDAALDVVATAHQLKSALSHIRNTRSGGNDYYEARAYLKSVCAEPDNDDALFQRMILAKMIHLRAEKFTPLFRRSQEVLAIAKAFFADSAVPEKFRGLAESYINILVFADGYPAFGGNGDSISSNTIEFIFAGGLIGSPDKFAAEIDESVSMLERILTPVIRPEYKSSIVTK